MYFIKCFDFVVFGWKSLYFIKVCDRRLVLFFYLLFFELFIRVIFFDFISILNLKLWVFFFKNCIIVLIFIVVFRILNVINLVMC